MQDSQKLNKILAEARTLEEKISESINLSDSNPGVHRELKQEINQFIASNQRFSCLNYIGSQTTISDIPLGEIIKQFIQIKELIGSHPHNPTFFRSSPPYHLTPDKEEQLKSHLKTIREELNKFRDEHSAREKISIKSAAPGA
jgi:hypothetical protein